MNADRSAGVALSSRAAGRKSAGLDSGTPAAAHSDMPSIALLAQLAAQTIHDAAAPWP
jgi:hypothetical protein